MKEFSFLLEFRERYGLKESIVLTEICRQVFSSKDRDVFFDFEELFVLCPFVTSDQLRRLLENLTCKKCLIKFNKTFGPNNFGHKNVFKLDDGIFCEYSEHHKKKIYEQLSKVSGY